MAVDTIPPIRNLIPMILNPSPSSLSVMMSLPIQIHKIPKATSIIPAAINGLNS